METAELVHILGTHEREGLSPEEAARRLAEVGPNVIPRQEGPSALRRFVQQFRHPLVYVLLVAGTVTSFMPGHGAEAGVIFGVVVVYAVLGFIQESRARAAIASLAELLGETATVYRGGRAREVDASELVPGDLVALSSGDRVPADLRCVRVRDLHVDESMLTGESLPVGKECGVLEEGVSVPDRKNMVYSGTLVTYGQGLGVVVATGERTELGRISGMVARATTLATPLTRKIARFSKLLSWVILGLAAVTLGIALLQGHTLARGFIAAVALAVAAIPEGLPAALTVILAIGVSRMAQRNALVRRLPAVETLGSTTVICSDKTGTLTKNQMTVLVVEAGGTRYAVSGAGYEPEGKITLDGEEVSLEDWPALRECIVAGVLCNSSSLEQRDGRWVVQGDPTEGALLTVAHKAGLAPERLREEAPALDVVPFESQHQYMASLHPGADGGRVIYMKGAAERVVGLCEAAMEEDGDTRSLDRDEVLKRVEELAGEGLRVMAFARKAAGDEQTRLHHDDLKEGLVFVGLQGMMDPARPEAVKAVKACLDAGIKVKMVTGDHPLTARAIAEECGLARGGEVTVLSGPELEEMPEEKLPEAAERTHVFARVTPEQKLRLVEAFQSRGEVVAMTGDGVNDAPALKQADIGVAMGMTGTEAAREASDMVLTDDNFASIEAAVEEGRGVYDNLRKFITWQLPVNGGESMLLLAAIVGGFTLPLEPVQVLWINMVCAVALGSTLAFEPKEQGIMSRPPRDPDEPVLTPDLVWRTGYVSAFVTTSAYLMFFSRLRAGAELEVARTIAVHTVIMVEIGYLFACRSLRGSSLRLGLLSNRYALGGVALMLLLQAGFIYLPVSHLLFGTAPLRLSGWLVTLAPAVVIFATVEVEKYLRRRFAERRGG